MSRASPRHKQVIRAHGFLVFKCILYLNTPSFPVFHKMLELSHLGGDPPFHTPPYVCHNNNTTTTDKQPHGEITTEGLVASLDLVREFSHFLASDFKVR